MKHTHNFESNQQVLIEYIIQLYIKIIIPLFENYCLCKAVCSIYHSIAKILHSCNTRGMNAYNNMRSNLSIDRSFREILSFPY